MGGNGSGQWYRRDKKTTVDECRQIDVNYLAREKCLTGYAHALTWSANNKEHGSIRVLPQTNGVRLEYWLRKKGADWIEVEYLVPIEYTKNGFGERPWFLCPSCRRRCGKLYLTDIYFVCIRCGGLSYQSRNENEENRLLEQARKYRRKLGASMDMTQSIFLHERPKGMHWKTYWKLIHKAHNYERRCWNLLAKQLNIPLT